MNQSINQSSFHVDVRTCSSRVMSGEYCVFCSSLNILYDCFDHATAHARDCARARDCDCDGARDATCVAPAIARSRSTRSLARSITRAIDRSIDRSARHPPRLAPNDARSIDARGNIRTFGHVESAPRPSTIALRSRYGYMNTLVRVYLVCQRLRYRLKFYIESEASYVVVIFP